MLMLSSAELRRGKTRVIRWEKASNILATNKHENDTKNDFKINFVSISCLFVANFFLKANHKFVPPRVRPRAAEFLRLVVELFSKISNAACLILSGFVPTSWFVPSSMVIGRSVFSRKVRHGIPSAVVSSCKSARIG